MALILPQIMYGFQVYDSGSSQNNKLDFKNNGVTYAATLNAGVYTPDELATEVQRAIRAIDSGHSMTCTFSMSTLKFTIGGGTGTCQLLWSTGANTTTNCHGILGNDNTSDDTGATSYTSDSAVGGANSTATCWTFAEPSQDFSPMTAQTIGTAALLTQRVPRVIQNMTDGGLIETIYFSTVKRVRISFDQLLAAEQTKMESFLDWAIQGRRFTYQPDSTATAALKLVMDPPEIANAFTWMTRSEVNYGSLTFFEALS